MIKQKIIYSLLFCFAIFSFKNSVTNFIIIPNHFPKPFYNFKNNPLSNAKILLGRVLFYDPILSRNNTISCASCHTSYTAFTHVDHSLSHGIDDKIGFRNSPILVNLAWQKFFMLDGAVNHLDMQALLPITNATEMDNKLDSVINKLTVSTIYPKLFYNAFGDSVITGQHTLLALSQFLLTLVSSTSKYDSVINKYTTFTIQENKGYQIFKKQCATCHTEPLFTNNQFMNNGLALDTFIKDYGRMKITQKNEDSLKFKVPTLRNIEFSAPYMHDGRFKKLNEVLNHYSTGVIYSSTLALQLKKSSALSADDKVDLTAFLLTLSDKKFLFNPKFAFPKKILLK